MKLLKNTIFPTLLLVLMALTTSVAPLMAQSDEKEERKPVDISSRLLRPVQVGDSSVMAMVGEVMLFHNGTLITCDSLVRYSANRVECFDNVVINKDSIYVYGDRALYNGETNTAEIFSPLIKLIDGNATVYTYNFKFNTKDNIGEFWGGATMEQEGNQMEADKGYYYADDREIVGVGNVELRNEEYMLRSDSVGYNFESEIAKFYDRSVIWNRKGEILSADSGEYFYQQERYHFRGDAYILSPDYEVWADSLDYNLASEDAELWNNIQVRSDKEKTIVFGDYGRYTGADGEALLTDRPSLLSYKTENADTVYMRSDSIFIYTVDSLGYFKLNRPDSTAMAEIDDIVQGIAGDEEELLIEENPATPAEEGEEGEVTEDGAEGAEDATEGVEDAAEDAELADEAIAEKEQADEQPDEVVEDSAAPEEIDDGEEIADEGVVEDVVAEEEIAEQITDEAITEAETTAEETTAEATAEEAVTEEKTSEEEVAEDVVTEEKTSEEETDEEATSEDATEEKRNERVIVAFPHVKMYSVDAQVVCDSLIAFTVDSTAQLHIDPIMWNEQNQIISEMVDVFTKDQKVERALFSGEPFPMMISEVDTTRYNQVTGKTIENFFRDGKMYKADIVGNAQTYYYVVDDKDGAVQGFLVAECADITFNIKDNTVETIVWRQNPEYTIYPITKIPETQTQFFEHFSWDPELRPTLEDVFDRTITPSERSEYEAMDKPKFPITKSIDNYRQMLVERGRWVDREDEITDRAREFISTREPYEE